MTCIRKPGSVWTLCRCLPCKASNNRLAKRYRSGHALIHGRDAAWARLSTWHRRGWSPQVVADVTGLSDVMVRDCYRAIETGRTIPIVQASVLKVLNAPDAPTGSGYVPSTGSTRRLRALTVMGWAMAELGARFDVDPSTLSTIRSGRLRTITGNSAALVERIYAELWDERGPGAQAATRARNRGWLPPLAWDDDIDDPNAEPAPARTDATHRFAGRPNADVVEDVAWLLEHDAAVTTQQVAERLGMRTDSLGQALRRAGEHDMAQRLALNGELTSMTTGRRSA